MKNNNLWIYLSIIVCILASIRLSLRKILSHIDLDKDIIAAILECGIGFFGFIYLLLNYKRIKLKKISKNDIFNVIAIAFFTLFSSILTMYTLSLTNNTSSVVSIINFNVVLTTIVSILYFKEKINIYTFTGIFMSFIGLLLIINYHNI
jgi:drug/metabolite transporter (DMT)-like permease